jgi:hypothetical protein
LWQPYTGNNFTAHLQPQHLILSYLDYTYCCGVETLRPGLSIFQHISLSMCCAYSTYPVTDLGSGYSSHTMSNKLSLTPQRRKEIFPVRTVLPSREPSKEDLELAQHLIGHAQGIRGDPILQDGQSSRSTPSPAYNTSTPGSTSPSAQRLREIASRSSSLERSQHDQAHSQQREQSYPRAQSIQSVQSDAVPAGQVCRLVLPFFRKYISNTMQQLRN